MDVQRLERFLINNGVGAEQAKKIAEDGVVKKEELANTGLTEEQQQSIFGFQKKEDEKNLNKIIKGLENIHTRNIVNKKVFNDCTQRLNNIDSEKSIEGLDSIVSKVDEEKK